MFQPQAAGAERWGQENIMNSGSELIKYLPLVIVIITFPVRSYYIRKRIIKIHDQLRKTRSLNTNKIDFTGLQPLIKHSSTEQILSKIESYLKEIEKQPQQIK